jgi:DNA-binding response OmpR family regulator
MKILVVDDDLDLLGLISYALRQAGYFVLEAGDGDAAWRLLLEECPDLLVLDVNLPGRSGFDLLRDARAAGVVTPVIMLTVRASEEDQVMGLDLGADDYLTKPFSPRMLLARIRANLRRAGEAPNPTIEVGRLRLHAERRVVVRDSETVIDLTGLEHRLLRILLANAGEVVAAERLAAHVWGYRDDAQRQLLKQLVHRLRRKIEVEPSSPAFVLTDAGIGYRLDPFGGRPPSAGTA